MYRHPRPQSRLSKLDWFTTNIFLFFFLLFFGKGVVTREGVLFLLETRGARVINGLVFDVLMEEEVVC